MLIQWYYMWYYNELPLGEGTGVEDIGGGSGFDLVDSCAVGFDEVDFDAVDGGVALGKQCKDRAQLLQ